MSRTASLVGLLVMAIGTLFPGCKPHLAAVYDVSGAPIVTRQSSTADDVRDAILRALATKNYTVKATEERAVVAEARGGGHSATMRIEFTADHYNITRVESSPGLKYDDDDNRIHRRYNHWVRLLRDAIDRELLAL